MRGCAFVYRTLRGPTDEELNALGAEGWRVHSVTPVLVSDPRIPPFTVIHFTLEKIVGLPPATKERS